MKVVQRISIKNYLGTESRFVDFSEKDDSILIVGENAKGKTTIMRAIYLCLTGEDAFFGSTNLDSIIRDGAEEMSISMEILSSDQSSIYFIEASKKVGKPLKVKIHENGVLLNTSELITDAKEILVSLFGNPLSIKNTYFMFSSSDDDFVNATNSGRLDIITKSSNIFTEYEMISESAKNMAANQENEKIRIYGEFDNERNRTVTLEQQLETLNNEITALVNCDTIDNNSINDFVTKNNDKRTLLEKSVNLISEKVKLDNEISGAKDVDIVAIKKSLTDDDVANEKNTELNNQISKLRDSQSIKMREKETFLKEFSAKTNEVTRLKATNQTNKSNIKVISDEDRALVYANDIDLVEKKNEMSQRKTELDNMKSKGIQINSNIDSKTKEINETKELFNHSKECPVCHSELTEKALSLYIDKIQSEINTLTAERDELRTTYAKLFKEYEKLDLAYNTTTISRTNTKIENDIIENEKLIVEIEKIANEINAKMNAIEEEISKVDSQYKELESKKLKTLSAYERNSLQSKIESVTNLDAKVERLNTINNELSLLGNGNDLVDIKSKIELINKENDTLKFKYGQYVNIVKNIQESKDNVIKLEKDLVVINKNIEQYNNIRTWYGKNGIQKEQIEHILSSVEHETNGMVNKFFDNIAVQFSYDSTGIGLNILRQSYNENGIENKVDVIKNFSDAQQEVLKTLLKLSFSKVLQYLNNTPLNIVFLNETFNTLSVDKEEELVNILKYFAEDYQVFFITHNQSIISKYESTSIVKL